MRFPVHVTLSFLLLFAWAGGGGLGMAREKKEEEIHLPPPPPQPAELKLEVSRNGEVEAPLHIYGSQRETLRFLLRSKPQFGKLERLRTTGRETASVVYHPPADLAVHSDRFAYSVQNSLGVSAPAEVLISIVDLAPLLIVPDTINFDPLLIGHSARQDLVIANQGGGVAEGEVGVNPPWRIDGSPAYRLAAGQTQTFGLIFEPLESGKSRAEIRYSSHLDRVTSLRGEGQAALTFEPAAVVLQALPESTVRTGEVTIVNHTETDQIVRLKPDPVLAVAETVTVPAGGKAPLTIQTKPGEVGPLRAELGVEGAGGKYSLTVKAERVGPVLEAPKEPIHFRGVAGQSANGWLTVRNIGGSEGFYRVEPPAPFQADPLEMKLVAGEAKRVELRIVSAEQDHFRGWLKISGEGQTRELEVEADVRAATAAPSSAGWRAAGPKMTSAREDEPANEPPPAEPESPATPPQLPGTAMPVVPCDPPLATDHSITLVWAETLFDLHRFVIEERKLEFLPDDTVKQHWEEHAKTKFRKANGKVSAEIDGLRPASIYTLRVVPITASNQHRPPMFELNAATKPRPPSPLTPMRGLLAALLGCFGFIGWRRLKAA